LLFFLISIAMVTLVFGYCGWRLIIPAQLSDATAAVAWGSLMLLACLTHVYHMLLRDSGRRYSRFADGIAWLAYSGVALAALTFTLLVVRDLAWLLYLGASKVVWYTLGGTDPEPLGAAGIIEISNLGIICLSTITTSIGMFQARRRPRVVDVTVPIRDLPPALHGFRIAQICDIHVGPTIKRPFVEAIVETVNGLEADLVAVVGDLADGPVERLRSHVSALARLRSRHGNFFVTGNHEYYSGVTDWIQEIRGLGLDVLVNENRLIEHGDGRLVIAGVTDFGAAEMVPHLPEHVHDPNAALGNAPPADVRVLLAHQPRSVSTALKAGFDLMLCGHTHGGQFIPWNFVVPLQQPYLAGLHEVGDSSWIYVSRGTGYWGPPVRVNAPSEVTCITLQPAT
jgi:hypothetical protein